MEEEVATYEREGEVAQEAMEVGMEEAAAVATDVAIGKMHAAAARKVVEALAMEAAMAALHAMRNEAAMVSLEAVANEANATVCELPDGVIMYEAEAEAQMYIDDAAAEESRVATATVAVGRSSAWLLVDGDEMEVEDYDEDKEAEAAVEAEHDSELRATDAAIREAAAQRDAEFMVRVSEECYKRHRAEDLAESRVKVEAPLATTEAQRITVAEAADREAAERAAHWAAKMDKVLAYRRDIDRREVGRCAQTEHRLERRRTLRRWDTAIRTAMAAIDAIGAAGNSDGAALPWEDGSAGGGVG
jgi:hypothetical protein